MNEWKSCFFFRCPEKKNSFEIEWINGQRTYPRAKKKKKICRKFSGKDKNQPVFFSRVFGKKKTRFSNLNEWMANELSREKKIRYLWLGIGGRNFKITKCTWRFRFSVWKLFLNTCTWRVAYVFPGKVYVPFTHSFWENFASGSAVDLHDEARMVEFILLIYNIQETFLLSTAAAFGRPEFS